MTFATVETVNGGTTGTGTGTSHTVNLPTGIVSGNLLIAKLVAEKITGGTNVTWPAGWTELDDQDFDSAVLVGTESIAFRRADGTEGSTISVTTADTVETSHYTMRISGHHTSTDPEIGTFAESSSETSTPDPPSLSPSWGAEDTLWVVSCVFVHGGGSGFTVDAAPTNYTNLRQDGTLKAVVGTARRELNASSENPGTFTLSGNRRWGAQTLAVRPAAAAGGLSIPVAMASYRQRSVI